MEFIKKHIKIISVILCVAILIGVGLCFAFCSSPAPELDSVRDRFVWLIESSKEVNEIFFGVGLPVYVKNSLLEDELGIYVGQQNQGYRVMEVSTYFLIDQMKSAAEQVYSSDYCSELYETNFDGVIVDGVTVIQYYESGDWVYQSVARDELVTAEKIYDSSSMRIVRPSNSDYVRVSIECYQIDKPDKLLTEELSFVFEDGNWYLDSPTY